MDTRLRRWGTDAADRGDLLFGTMDTWVLWNMTGGPEGGIHVTDVTNASRTMLMDIDTLTWRDDIAAEMGIPLSMLPEIRSSSEVYGHARAHGMLAGVPISASWATSRRPPSDKPCSPKGWRRTPTAPATSCSLNTGHEARALEERAAARRSATRSVTHPRCTRWRARSPSPDRSYSGCATTSECSERTRYREAGAEVDDNGGAYFVPAFSGLFAPYWRSDARGALLGLTRYVTKNHIARAALEATAYQTREVMDAMNADAGVALAELRVDGGMVANELLMQFQADILGVDVIRPSVIETTALGAAYAAGIAVGFWSGEQDVTTTGPGIEALDASHAEHRARPVVPQLEKGRDKDHGLGGRGCGDDRPAHDGRGPGRDEASGPRRVSRRRVPRGPRAPCARRGGRRPAPRRRAPRPCAHPSCPGRPRCRHSRG